MERVIGNDVLNVLSAAICIGAELRLTGQLDRKLYVRTNEVLEALGGKWNRKAKAHLFDDDASDIVESAILLGSYARDKQDFGFFETPTEVTKNYLLPKAGVNPSVTLLEPSAGRGAIADHARDQGAKVQCVEIQEKNCTALGRSGHQVLMADFLTVAPETHRKVDRVVMNPPFAKRADIHHIMHARKFLNPGGKLVSVASSSIAFRDDKLAKQFREFIAAHDGEITNLPSGSFKASGTMVNTVVVSLTAS